MPISKSLLELGKQFGDTDVLDSTTDDDKKKGKVSQKLLDVGKRIEYIDKTLNKKVEKPTTPEQPKSVSPEIPDVTKPELQSPYTLVSEDVIKKLADRELSDINYNELGTTPQEKRQNFQELIKRKTGQEEQKPSQNVLKALQERDRFEQNQILPNIDLFNVPETPQPEQTSLLEGFQGPELTRVTQAANQNIPAFQRQVEDQKRRVEGTQRLLKSLEDYEKGSNVFGVPNIIGIASERKEQIKKNPYLMTQQEAEAFHKNNQNLISDILSDTRRILNASPFRTIANNLLYYVRPEQYQYVVANELRGDKDGLEKAADYALDMTGSLAGLFTLAGPISSGIRTTKVMSELARTNPKIAANLTSFMTGTGYEALTQVPSMIEGDQTVKGGIAQMVATGLVFTAFHQAGTRDWLRIVKNTEKGIYHGMPRMIPKTDPTEYKKYLAKGIGNWLIDAGVVTAKTLPLHRIANAIDISERNDTPLVEELQKQFNEINLTDAGIEFAINAIFVGDIPRKYLGWKPENLTVRPKGRQSRAGEKPPPPPPYDKPVDDIVRKSLSPTSTAPTNVKGKSPNIPPPVRPEVPPEEPQPTSFFEPPALEPQQGRTIEAEATTLKNLATRLAYGDKNISAEEQELQNQYPNYVKALIDQVKETPEYKEREIQKKRQAKQKVKTDTYNYTELNRQFKHAQRKRNEFDTTELRTAVENITTPEIREKADKLLSDAEKHNENLRKRNEFTLENVSRRKYGTTDLNSLSEDQQQAVLNEYNEMKKQGITEFKQLRNVKPTNLKGEEDAVQEQIPAEIPIQPGTGISEGIRTADTEVSLQEPAGEITEAEKEGFIKRPGEEEAEVVKPTDDLEVEPEPDTKVEKQPYEMTKEEFLSNKKKSIELLKNSPEYVKLHKELKETAGKDPDDFDVWGEDYHKIAVEQALAEGKKVPESVLKDYPDLQTKVETPKEKWNNFFQESNKGQNLTEEIIDKYPIESALFLRESSESGGSGYADTSYLRRNKKRSKKIQEIFDKHNISYEDVQKLYNELLVKKDKPKEPTDNNKAAIKRMIRQGKSIKQIAKALNLTTDEVIKQGDLKDLEDYYKESAGGETIAEVKAGKGKTIDADKEEVEETNIATDAKGYPIATDNYGYDHTIKLWGTHIVRTSPVEEQISESGIKTSNFTLGGSGWEWWGFKKQGDIWEGYVEGFENEYGSFRESELKENGVKIVTDPKELQELNPPIEWKWKQKKVTPKKAEEAPTIVRKNLVTGEVDEIKPEKKPSGIIDDEMTDLIRGLADDTSFQLKKPEYKKDIGPKSVAGKKKPALQLKPGEKLSPEKKLKAIQLVEKFIEKEVYQFDNIVLAVDQAFGRETTEKIFPALKAGYTAYLTNASDAETEKMDSFDYVKKYVLKATPEETKKVQDIFAGKLPTEIATGFEPRDGWRTHLIKAREYAKALNIEFSGKSLEILVRDIDATLEMQGKPAPKKGEPRQLSQPPDNKKLRSEVKSLLMEVNEMTSSQAEYKLRTATTQDMEKWKEELTERKSVSMEQIYKEADIASQTIISRPFIQRVREEIRKGNVLTKTQLEKIAQEFDITDPNIAKEQAELAIVAEARKIINETPDEKEAYDKVVEMYKNQPNLTHRTNISVENQQYFTPAPISYVAGLYVADGVGNGDVLEPSAGNGMLVIAFNTGQVYVNEIDAIRNANLRQTGYEAIANKDAEKSDNLFNKKFDGIITNPPFGSAETKRYDDYKLNKLEHIMAANALKQMKKDGRAAIIIGGHNRYDNKGRLQSDRTFFNWLHHHYNVDAVLNIDGDLYKKQGTQFPIRLLLISGKKPTPQGAAPLFDAQRDAVIKDFEDLYNRMKEIRDGSLLQPGTDAERGSGGITDVRSPKGKDIQKAGGTETIPEAEISKPDTEKPTKSGETTTTDIRPSGTGEPVSGKPGTTGRPDTGKPALPGSVPGGKTKQGDRRDIDAGRSDKDVQQGFDREPTPVASRAVLESDKPFLPYKAESGGVALDTVIPRNMSYETSKQLKNLAEDVGGDIDQYVADKLEYKDKDELYSHLGAEQIDAVALAITAIEKNQGMIIGDMTGVGKGRIAASVVRYAVKNGYKPIFFTEKADLFSDFYRDLVDTGNKELNPFIVNSPSVKNSPNIVDEDGNVIHKAYAGDKKNESLRSGNIGGHDFVLCTYSQVNSERRGLKRSFISDLAEDNIVIMDESHNASGDSNTGIYFRDVVQNAKGVTYLSATFAKRPDNMPVYAVKTAISEANLTESDLVSAIESGGVALQEILSTDMVEAGQMIRREKSYEGIKVEYKPLTEKKTEHTQVVDSTTEIIRDIIRFQSEYIKPIISDMDSDAAAEGSTVTVEGGTNMAGVDNTPFASKVFNVIDQLLFSIKAESAADEAIQAIKKGQKPVIAVKNTMESFLDYLGVQEGEIIENTDFSTILERGLRGIFRIRRKDATGDATPEELTLNDLSPEGRIEYKRIMDKINTTSVGITISPIDHIIYKLNKAGIKVGEVTGRDIRLRFRDDGKAIVERRTEKDKKKILRDFNNWDNPGQPRGIDGHTDMVLLLNASGSTGRSAHSSPKFKDQRQRIMVGVQIELNINTEIQKRGRINRTGQVNKPEYLTISSAIPAEQRLLMMAKKKLKSLDANVSSDQSQAGTTFEANDFLNRYGDRVVVEYLKENRELNDLLLDPLKMDAMKEDELENFVTKENAAHKVTGRVAILPTQLQEDFYTEIGHRYDDYIEYLDSIGENDLEVKVMPLDAVTTSSRMLVAGKGGFSPFGRDSMLETSEVNVLKKPHKMEKVTELLDKYLEGKGKDEKKKELIADQKTFWKGWSETHVERKKDVIAKNLEISKEDLNKHLAGGISIQDLMRKYPKLEGKEAYIEMEFSKYADLVNKLLAQQDYVINNIFSRFSIGRVYKVPLIRDSVAPSYSNGIFLGWEVNPKRRNPYAPSAIKLKFAVADSRQIVPIPASQRDWLNDISSESYGISQWQEKDILSDWDNALPDNRREVKNIVTGNILQAVADVRRGAGQLISYTTKDGGIRRGILIKDNRAVSSDEVRIPIKRALPYIKQLPMGDFIESVGGEVVLTNDRGKTWTIEVPASKAKGGKFYLDEAIKNLVKDGRFDKWGNQMRAEFKRENLDKLINVLQDDFGISVRLSQDQIKRIGDDDTSLQLKPGKVYKDDFGKDIPAVFSKHHEYKLGHPRLKNTKIESVQAKTVYWTREHIESYGHSPEVLELEKLVKGDYGYEAGKEKFAVEITEATTPNPEGTGTTITISSTATPSAYTEGIIHTIYKGLEKENPDLLRKINLWEQIVREEAEAFGIHIPQGEETFAQAMVFTHLGYATENPNVAEVFEIPKDILDEFTAILNEGKVSADVLKGDTQRGQIRLPSGKIDNSLQNFRNKRGDTAFQMKSPISRNVKGKEIYDKLKAERGEKVDIYPEWRKQMKAEYGKDFDKEARQIWKQMKQTSYQPPEKAKRAFDEYKKKDKAERFYGKKTETEIAREQGREPESGEGNLVDFGSGLGQVFTASADKINEFVKNRRLEKELGIENDPVLKRYYREFLTAPQWFFDKEPQLKRVWDVIDRHFIRNVNEESAILREDEWKNGKTWRKLTDVEKKEFNSALEEYEQTQYELQRDGEGLELLNWMDFADEFALTPKVTEFLMTTYKPTIETALDMVKDVDRYRIINETKHNPYLQNYYEAVENKAKQSTLDSELEKAKDELFADDANYEALYENELANMVRNKKPVNEVTALETVWQNNPGIREVLADVLIDKKYEQIDGKVYFPSSRLDKKYYLSGLRKTTPEEKLLQGKFDDRFFTTNDNLSKLNTTKAELEAQGYKVKVGKFADAQEEILRNAITQEDLLDLALSAGVEQDNPVLERLVKTIQAKGFSRHFIAKRFIPGFEYNAANFEEAIYKYIKAVPFYKNRTIGGKELGKTMAQLKQSGVLKPGSANERYIQDLKTKIENRDVKLSQGLRAVASTYYLALSPAYLAQQIVQPLNTLLPLLPITAKELGLKSIEAEKAFGEALFSSIQYWAWKVYDKANRMAGKPSNLTFGLDRDFLTVIKSVERQGVGKPLRSLELAGHQVDPQKHYTDDAMSKVTGAASWIAKIAGMPGIMVEDFTRTIGIRAFYTLGKKAGLKGEKLYDYISANIAKSFGPASGRLAKPPGYYIAGEGRMKPMKDVAQSTIESWLTFKNFAFMNYGQWGKTWRALKNDTMFRPMAYKLAAQFGMGGLKYMMWTSTILTLLSGIYAMFDITEDPEEQYKDLFMQFNKLVPGLGDALYKGLGSLTFKVDLSALFAQTAPIEEPFTKDAIELIGGAPASAIKDIVTGTAPRATRGYQITDRWEDKGVTLGGRKLIPPEEITEAEKTKRKLGFNPLRMSEAYQKENTRQFKSKQYTDIIRSKAKSEIVPLIESGKGKEAREIFKKLMEEMKADDVLTEGQKKSVIGVNSFISQVVLTRLETREREIIKKWKNNMKTPSGRDRTRDVSRDRNRDRSR